MRPLLNARLWVLIARLSSKRVIGYPPGHMPYKFGERLQRLGVTLANKKADPTCQVDRKLITGASPEAANDFGRVVAQQLLSCWNMDGHKTPSSPPPDPPQSQLS